MPEPDNLPDLENNQDSQKENNQEPQKELSEGKIFDIEQLVEGFTIFFAIHTNYIWND